MGVLLRQLFLVRDGLDCGVIVILVHLAVDCLCSLLMAMRLHLLLDDSGADGFVNIGSMSLVGGEMADGFFGGLHNG